MSDAIGHMPGVNPTQPAKPANPVRKDGERNRRGNTPEPSRVSDEEDGETSTSSDERTNRIDEYI